MRTVNLTLDDALWREARLAAAARDESVSALMREALRRMLGSGGRGEALESEEQRDQREREQLADLLRGSQLGLGFQPTRERTYER
jgi:hypothetical protein